MKAHRIAAVTLAAALVACGSSQVSTQATAPLEPNRVGDPNTTTSEGVTTTGANATAQPETRAHTTGSNQGASRAETSEPVNQPPVPANGNGALPHQGTPHPVNTGDPCGPPCNGNRAP